MDAPRFTTNLRGWRSVLGSALVAVVLWVALSRAGEQTTFAVRRLSPADIPAAIRQASAARDSMAHVAAARAAAHQAVMKPGAARVSSSTRDRRGRDSVQDWSAPLSPTFSFGDLIALDAAPASIASGDFRSTGRADLALAIPGANRIELWLNDGSGHLSEADTLACPTPLLLAAADLDGDGRLDLIAATPGTPGAVEIFRGLGGGRFEAPYEISAARYPAGLAVADLDGDGRPDIVVSRCTDDSVLVFRNLGAAFAPGVALDAGPDPCSIVVDDLDHDGHPEIVTESGNALSFSVLHNRGDGTFDPPATYADHQLSGAIQAADLDGDGWPDLVLSGVLGNVDVIWSDRCGGFATETRVDAEFCQSFATIVRPGLHGAPEIAYSSGDSYSHGDALMLTTARYDGRRDSLSTLDYRLDGEWWGPTFSTLSTAGLDAGGRGDLIAVGAGFMIILSDEAGAHLSGLAEHHMGRTFQTAHTITLEDGTPAILALDPSGNSVWPVDNGGLPGQPIEYSGADSAMVVDVDGDGCADVLIPRGDSLDVHYCGGARVRLPRPRGPGSIAAIADFNGDGIPDYLLELGPDSLAIAFSSALHGVADPVPLSITWPHYFPAQMHAIVASDFDGDGIVDLAFGGFVVGQSAVDSVIVYRGDGGGAFSRMCGVELPSCSGPNSWQCPIDVAQLLVADVNGDGLPDLIPLRWNNYGGGDIPLVYNHGDSQFAVDPNPLWAISEGPRMFVRDLNGDGLPDLVLFTYNDDVGVSRLQVRMNVGFGFEQGGFIHSIEHYVNNASIADLNRDGRPDLILAYNQGDYFESGFSTLINVSNSALVPHTISLSHTDADIHDVSLTWSSTGLGIRPAILCRRTGTGAWRDVATLTDDGSGQLNYEDHDVTPGQRYSYRLRYSDGGRDVFAGAASVLVPALTFALQGVRPNPGDGRMTVAFSVPTSAPVSLEVIDVAGRRVRAQRIERPEPGPQSLDLTAGTKLPLGVYWVRLAQAGRSAATKAVVLR